MKHFFFYPVRQSACGTFLFLLCCCLSSFLSMSSAYAQLAGTYSIGGPDGTYSTFTEAIRALQEEGVAGAVTFTVQPGIYNEQLLIGNIPGSSCATPIHFEGSGTTQAQVVLQAPEEAEFTLSVNGADGIGFRHLSIAGNMLTSPGTDCFQLEDNILLGNVEASSSADERSDRHLYRDNYFQTGRIAKRNAAPWNPGSPVFDEGLIIEGNSFERGNITVEGQSDFILSNNVIPDLSGLSVGIQVKNSWYGKKINENHLGASVDNFQGTGMILESGAAAEIAGNSIITREGGVALRITTGKTRDNSMLIANNLLSVSGYDARGIYYFPISNLVGLDITNNNVSQVKLYHNSISVAGYSEYVPNYSLAMAGLSNSFYVVDNIIMNASGGTGIVVGDPDVIAQMDYNNLYMSYANLFAEWGGAQINSFSEWQNITGFGTHSLSVNPGPLTNPEEILKGAGIYLAEVPVDYAGQERGTPPTIGAFEKAAPAKVPISGIYTIGGESPDFTSFTAAMEAVSSSGIQDSVVFKIRPGTYTEQLKIPSFGGDSKLTFIGQSDDSTAVVLTYPFGPALLLEHAQNITLRHMTIATGIYSVNSSNLRFENNTIEGGVEAYTTSKDTYRQNLFLGEGIRKEGQGHEEQGGNHFYYMDKEVVIEENNFEVRGNAVSLVAQSEVWVNNNSITIEEEGAVSWVSGISISGSEAVKEVNNNTIVSLSPNTTGLGFSQQLFEGELPQEATNNRIWLREGGIGMNFNFVSESGSPASLVANNMLSINTSKEGNSSIGISTFLLPGELYFYHNSVYLYGEDSNSRVVVMDADLGEASVYFKNNLLANLADGLVMNANFYTYDGFPVKIASSDYNNLFTSGDTLAIWNKEVVSDFAGWQALTGFDTHSIAVDPQFMSAELLVPGNGALDNAGTAIPEVPEDFFGKARATPPTIGAVEMEEENQLPVVNAGRDQTVSLPIESLYLQGTGHDPDGRFRSFLWEKVSGPGVRMLKANTANVQLKGLAAGEYVFRFTATDNKGGTASDEMKLTVKSSNQLPVVSAGADKTVFLPLENLVLSGTGKDPDGRFTAFLWEKLSGPSVNISRERTANLVLSELEAGTYVLRFSATDNAGATVSDEMTLTVIQRNQPPVVHAGSDRTVSLPIESVRFSGTGTDPDGVFRAFLWEKISGPAVTMQNARTANLVLTHLQAGTYVFRFTATDNEGAAASDELELKVLNPVLASHENSIQVKAYPNTFRQYLYLSIRAEQPEEYSVEIYDVTGKVFYRNKLLAGAHLQQPLSMDVSDLGMGEGIYFIRVENRSRSFREVIKVIKGL